MPDKRTARRRSSIDNFMSSFGRKPKNGVGKNGAEKKVEKKSKSVHFSPTPVEVRTYNFDWNLEREVFFSREELSKMAKKRFEEAAELRKQLGTMINAMDDLVKPSGTGIKDLLQQAFTHMDEDTSIRGIEHFVYPQLQQEMVRRKQLVQAEVLTYARSKEPDPQGWRLASQSRYYTQWASNVAKEKGAAYISTFTQDVPTEDVPTEDAPTVDAPTEDSSFNKFLELCQTPDPNTPTRPDVPNNETELDKLKESSSASNVPIQAVNDLNLH